tara:strand:+ start:1395 stop:1580 length:186 start_codon:yes stop_codon:yes gene_type:complete
MASVLGLARILVPERSRSTSALVAGLLALALLRMRLELQHTQVKFRYHRGSTTQPSNFVLK